MISILMLLTVSMLVGDGAYAEYDAQPEWLWATSGGGPSNEDEIDAIAMDADGSVYAAGKFEQTIEVAGLTMTSRGAADIPVFKYDRNGALVWSRHFGGAGEDNVFDATVDSLGNLVLSGYFEGTVDFGGHQLTSEGGTDQMLVKLSPGGETLWAIRAGGPDLDGGNEVEVDGDDNIIVGVGSGVREGVGQTYSVQGVTFQNEGLQDAYLAKFDPDGGLLWVRDLAGPGIDRAKALGVDPEGNIFLGGDLSDEANAGDVTFTASTPAPLRDAFLSKWTSDGEIAWGKVWGGPANDLCKGVASDSQGNVYCVGPFDGAVRFDDRVLVSVGAEDLFVWKMDAEGSTIWLNQVISPDAGGAEVIVDEDDGLIFGNGMHGPTVFTSTDSHNRIHPGPSEPIGRGNGTVRPLAYLIRYTPAGSVDWLITADESFSSRVGEIALGGDRVGMDVVIRGDNRFGDHPAGAPGTNGRDFATVSVSLPG